MGNTIPKQYLNLHDRPVIIHTLERLNGYSRIHGIWVGLSQDDDHWPGLTEYTRRLSKLSGTYVGGAERAETVLKGLDAMADQADSRDWVLVHDAVRPCLRHSDIDKLIDAVGDCADGALLGVPITDTIKRTDTLGHIEQTVPRTGIWRALTPQLFPLQLLTFALTQALEQKEAVTDEAMAVERIGKQPCMIAGHSDNIKITLPEDLALAELYLTQQTGAGA